jgi:hypothetical protein
MDCLYLEVSRNSVANAILHHLQDTDSCVVKKVIRLPSNCPHSFVSYYYGYSGIAHQPIRAEPGDGVGNNIIRQIFISHIFVILCGTACRRFLICYEVHIDDKVYQCRE